MKKLSNILIITFLYVILYNNLIAQTTEEIMSDAGVFQEVVLSGASVDILGIVNNPSYSATQMGDFAVYEKELSVYWEGSPSVRLRFAINPSGDFYVGAIGKDHNVLSTLSSPTWHSFHTFGFFELKNYTTLLFHILQQEHKALSDGGYITGGPEAFNWSDIVSGYWGFRGPNIVSWYNLETRIYNGFSKSLIIAHSAVSVNDPTTYTMDPFFIEINDRWWPFSSGSIDGTATRHLTLQYENAELSYVVAWVGNDNGNSTSISIDGQVAASNGSSVGKAQYLQADYYPAAIEMTAYKVWSVSVSAASVVILGDDISFNSNGVNPDGGPIENPTPLKLVLAPGWNEDKINAITDNTLALNSNQLFILHNNYPNPFNPSTNIGFSLRKTTHVKIDIFNSLGQKVATILDESRNSGYHTVVFDGMRMGSGVYWYKMEADNQIQSKKMLLLK